MNRTDPVDLLMDEHRLIERVIADMRRKAEEIGGGGVPSPHYALTVADFFHGYADACHHGKEEDILFARLEGRDLSPEDAKMMQGLIREHEWARTTTEKLRQAGDRFAHGESDVLGEIAKHLKGLAQFYPQHVKKEDGTFFPASRNYFSPEEWRAMAEEFREFDSLLVHQRYAAVVDELEHSGAEAASVGS